MTKNMYERLYFLDSNFPFSKEKIKITLSYLLLSLIQEQIYDIIFKKYKYFLYEKELSNMKRLIALCSTLCLGILIVLTSCNSDNLPAIEGSLSITIFKTALKVNTSFIDTEEHDLYNEKVQPYVIVGTTGEEAKEVSRKNVSISKSTGETIDRNMSGTALDITGLVADTEYNVKLMISSGGNQKTLATKLITTLNTGESAEDPILIDSLDMLLGMNKTNDAYYKLTKDIDCGGTLSTIFNSSTYFKGTLDGDGHKIYNLKFDSNNYTGLFGYMSGATVKNLVLEDVSYDATRSNTYLGALAGYAKHCVISNVTVNKMDVSHSGQTSSYGYIGGLVGQAIDSTIDNCHVNDLDLTIPKAQKQVYVGGFVGENENTRITNCSVTGSLNVDIAYVSSKDGNLYLGGFCGVNDSSKGIEDCFAKVDISVKEPSSVSTTGNQTFKALIGGFMGGNINDSARLKNVAIIGDITVVLEHAYQAYVGGIIGYTDDQNVSRLENCVYRQKEKGLTVTFMKDPVETEENDSTDEEDKEEDKTVKQTAYVSLAIAKIGAKVSSTMSNVIVYDGTLTILVENEKLIKTDYVTSKDISQFSQYIQDLFA